MIQPKDLRIGNAIYHVDADGNKTVTIVEWQHVVWCIDVNEEFNKHFSPISLTDEVLVKCGFEWSIFHQAIHKEGFNFDLNSRHMGGYFLTTFKKGIIIVEEINHLHHLQNLYHALTGEELIYKP